MSDRELLELAAKAAGVTGGWGELIKYGNGEVDLRDMWILEGDEFTPWDPINDDGDALRLAFALRLNVEFLGGFKQVQAFRADDAREKAYHLFGIVGYGKGADREPSSENVRRAIVRAAAEIGRSMP